MWNEERLNEVLTTPPDRILDDLKRLKGDFTILGAGGKIGPSLAIMLRKALKMAGMNRKIYAVDRYPDERAKSVLESWDIEVITCDLLQRKDVESLPVTENVFFLVGYSQDSDTEGNRMWAASTIAAHNVCEHYRGSSFVVMSSGTVYPLTDPFRGSSAEEVMPDPIGDYSTSTVAREHIFMHYANKGLIKAVVMRLSYAIDLRYGILQDIASYVMKGEAVRLEIPLFNCVWQGYVTEVIIRSLALLDEEETLVLLNVTGPETASVHETADLLGDYLNKPVKFAGESVSKMFLSNAGYCHSRFGYPTVSIDTLIRWQAEWILSGGRSLSYTSHFDDRPERP